ncbi:MAG: hypothetical protein ACPGWM_02170, partial [Flavobacteriales bacterium]
MSEAKELIAKLLEERSCLKQDVYSKVKETFSDLKEVLNDTVQDLENRFDDKDKRLEFYFRDKGEFEAEIKVAG